MPVRDADATWEGGLKGGKGSLNTGSGTVSAAYSFMTRFGDTPGTNPEELLGAAHAACYSMALSAGLEGAGFVPTRVHTTAKVTIDKVGDGFKITKIVLSTEALVPKIEEKAFQDVAQATKKACPVSQALSATPIDLEAKLLS